MVCGGVKCVKWLMFIFNFLFFLTGCALLGIAIFLHIDRDDWEDISDYNYISVANVIIAAGAIIIIIAFLGCCGAITENKIMLLAFFSMLVIIFILEVAAGISAYIWRGDIEDELHKQLKERIPARYNEGNIMRAMNSIQNQFDCCGIDGFTDWNVSSNQPIVDKSCCKKSGETGYNKTCSSYPFPRPYQVAQMNINWYNEKGCFKSIKDFLEDNLLYVGLTSIIFAVFQIMGMTFAMVLYSHLRKQGQTI